KLRAVLGGNKTGVVDDRFLNEFVLALAVVAWAEVFDQLLQLRRNSQGKFYSFFGHPLSFFPIYFGMMAAFISAANAATAGNAAIFLDD
ncbi:MAG: hypothetical protein RR655_06100, partial [Raoultibacter sp.]